MWQMINWQRIWDDDGSISRYRPARTIAFVLSLPYCLIINFRNWLYDQKILPAVKLACPVISVGNITVGGTGKTPCVIMLAKMLQKNGFQPAVLSRGYGGKSVKSVNIVADGQKILLESKTSGDEALLIAQSLEGVPVITGPQRIVTGSASINQFGANVLICDDAFQHRKIFRDIDLVLWDSQNQPGDDHILPRGRLREPIAGLRRAGAFVITRTSEGPQANNIIDKLAQTENIPIFMSIHKPKDIIKGDNSRQWPIPELKGKNICAFCGIAKPESFKNTLLAAGAQILFFDIFPDHHRYSENQLGKIKKQFIDYRADFLITTQKDAIRLQEFPEFLNIIYILRIEMEITPSMELFEKFILNELAAAQESKVQ
jgi:tetraacyldisaccharide 4'-kinase